MSLIKLALPKGSLENATYKFVETSGYTIKGQSRTYRPIISDKDIIVKVLRPQEIPKNIQEGTQDIGISGEAKTKIGEGFTSKDSLITGKSEAQSSTGAVQLESWKENY